MSLSPDPAFFDSVELISSGNYSEKGKKITIHVTPELLSSSLLKTDTTVLKILELDLQVPDGSARFTTIKDYIVETRNNLEKASSYFSAPSMIRNFHKFFEKLDQMIEGAMPFTLELDDPLGNAFVESDIPNHPNIEIEEYHRSFFQCQELGIPYKSSHSTIKCTDISKAASILSSMIESANHVVGFTGAGVSTESGIPAFRTGGKNLWSRFDPNKQKLMRFLGDENSQKDYWEIKTELNEIIKTARPNPSHDIFTYLHGSGKLLSLVTQNIDGLHHKSGLPKEFIYEIHGTVETGRCWECKKPIDPELIYPKLRNNEIQIPKCEECGGLIKLDTVSFGEPLPEGIMKQVIQDVKNADLFVVMGSSLVVAPVNRLPAIALCEGIPVVLVNIGETDFDDYVDLHVACPSGEVMERTISLLKQSPKQCDNFVSYYVALKNVRKYQNLV
eukprot:TRINITY_DN13100_c0_g1_i1.p1 TRINITY_DN13100_c0_g1~~TRINITY_DN13100_c0_g1_i1.p1  ORF type:complete len:446 (+),score=96.15 TRINITY_DN13100_c0_g1_i1:74-1411(+)